MLDELRAAYPEWNVWANGSHIYAARRQPVSAADFRDGLYATLFGATPGELGAKLAEQARLAEKIAADTALVWLAS